MINAAARELRGAIERLYPADVGDAVSELALPPAPTQREHVCASRDGYIQRINGEALLALAGESDTVVEVLRRPGDFVFAGQPLLAVWPPPSRARAFSSHAASAFIVGAHRTPEQDVEFSFEQLVQISLRALSPAYNDPSTAAACIEHLGAGFHRLFGRREPPAIRAGKDGRARLIARPVSMARLLQLVWPPILESARGSIIVTRQIGQTLAALADAVNDDAVREAMATIIHMLQQQLETVHSRELRDEVRSTARMRSRC